VPERPVVREHFEVVATCPARCLDGVDVAALPRRSFDGRNWEASIDQFRRRQQEGAGS